MSVNIDDPLDAFAAYLGEVTMANAGLEEGGFAGDETEEPHVIVSVEGGVDLDGDSDGFRAPHLRSEVLDDPQRVAVVEVEEDDVGAELGLAGANHARQSQIVVELLQALQAFGQVFRIDFLIEDVVIFLAQSLGAVGVPTGAFFHLCFE